LLFIVFALRLMILKATQPAIRAEREAEIVGPLDVSRTGRHEEAYSKFSKS